MTVHSPGAAYQGGQLITVGHLIAVLRGRWKSFAAGLLSLLAIGLVASLTMPKRYTATATVLIDVRSPDPISGAMLHGLISPSYMNTQIDLLQNTAVAKRAVTALRWLDDAEVKQRWLDATGGVGDAESWAATQLAKGMKVAPAKDSNLLEVTYTAPEPAFAARAANAFVKAFVDMTLALRHDPAMRHKQFFDVNTTRLRLELDAAQARLSTFEKEKGITADDRQVDVESARLLELNTQLVAMQSQAADTRSRMQQGASNSDLMQDSLASPLIIGLRADLQRSHTRLKEMLIARGENHPQVIELRESVAELERRITEESSRMSGGVAMSDRVNQQRVGDIRAALERQREKVAVLKASRDQALSLRRDVDNAQKAYEVVAARGSQMGLESQLNQSNVSIVGEASVPIEPSSPRVFVNLAGSAVLGILVGLCVALRRESLDRRIRLEADLTRLVQEPLLVTLPRYSVKRSVSTSGLTLVTPPVKRLGRS